MCVPMASLVTSVGLASSVKNWITNQTVITEVIKVMTVARIVMNVLPLTTVDLIDEVILSFANVSIASMTDPTVTQMLIE